ncbi:MAG TPA: hypothetical protein VHR66_28110 [Gemmataceae bacterium]|jgi:hypothetical protein|nr:hypothetical protein [Gemmataceae bacterium]
MEANGSIRTMNRRLAQKVKREGKENPKSPYANRYVGIANGKVIVIAKTLGEMMKALRNSEPDSAKCIGVDLVGDYDQVYEV